MQWVCVDERMPEIGEQVLIWSPRYKCIDMACREVVYSGHEQEEWIVWTDGEWGHGEVRYWMPLPEVPKEVRDA